MKRSLMVKLMTQEYLSLHRGGWADATEEERMSEVLKKMEEAGMQPPAYFDVQFYDEPECDGMISEWETEDEAK